MRWGLWLTVVLVLLLAAYMVWPLTGFYRIASAIEAKDATALAERVEFRSLRRSLTQQVIAEYLKLTGKVKSLGSLEQASPRALVPRLLTRLSPIPNSRSAS